MSEQKKNAAKRTVYYLGSARSHLDAAKKCAEDTGDRKLAERINKLHTETQTLQTEVADKLDSTRG
jgi:hypothetical protein